MCYNIFMKIKKINLTKIKSAVATIFLKVKKRGFIFLVVIILGAVLYYGKGLLIVAIVDGRPISRLTLINELDKQAGKNTLDSLITKALILQEARKQKIEISDDEVNKEIKQIEENLTSQGQDLDQVLGIQGVNRDELEKQIKIQKIVERIAGQDISVSDQEVDDYIEQNKELFTEDADMEETRGNIKQQLEQQKMNEEIPLWIESLHDKASIHYFR